MGLLENIKIALRSVRSNLLRSILTMMIIAFGIMSLVGILTAIDSAIYSLNDNFSSMGVNSFRVEPRGEGVKGNRRGRRSKRGEAITYDQGMEFKEKLTFPAKVSIATWSTGIATIKYQGEKTNPNIGVIAMDETYFDVKGYEIEYGRNLTELEILNGSNGAVLGTDIIDQLFDKKPEKALGETISVGNNKFKVLGVLKSKGSSMSDSGDRRVFISLVASNRIYGTADRNHGLYVGTRSPDELEAAIASTIGTFRTVRNLKIGQENDFEIEKSDGLINIIKDNTVTLRLAAVAIGLITLLGAAIGLMNIMLVSVTERTREIGVCKALGATRNNILVQFITEAIVICQLGGLFGILLGVLIGIGVAAAMGGSFFVPWGWIFLGIGTCMFVGLISGLYPALKAARLDPIESLRYE